VEARRLLVIDDDELSRAVLGMIAEEAGFEAESFESGQDVLDHLTEVNAPFAVLTDMQMPGICGNELALRLRDVCGAETILLAMSGSPVAKSKVAAFDGFLLKPFSAKDLKAACESCVWGTNDSAEGVECAASLSVAVYEKFSSSLSPSQLTALYKMCVDDSLKRLETMRRASAERDDAAYRRAAHAIKGGCGMVGALELAGLAAEMELHGLPTLNDDAPFQSFLAASVRLGRMLDRKAGRPRAATNASVQPL